MNAGPAVLHEYQTMPLSLYTATIPSYLQILRAVSGLLDKAGTFCAERGIAAADLIEARLAEDMLPFAYQVKSTVVHSQGAVEAVHRGVFSPDTSAPPGDFAALKARVVAAIAALEAVAPDTIDALIGRDMRFEFGERRIEYTAEEFLLSFSQPNFYFHAATAYDILRWKGLPIGKRDFIGRTRSRR